MGICCRLRLMKGDPAHSEAVTAKIDRKSGLCMHLVRPKVGPE